MPQNREIVFIRIPLISYDLSQQRVFGRYWLIKNAPFII